MQLILDAETAIGLEKKMSGINEDTLNNKLILAKNIIRDFSNNLTGDEKHISDNANNKSDFEKELSKNKNITTDVEIEKYKSNNELSEKFLSDGDKDCTIMQIIPDEKNRNLVNGVNENNDREVTQDGSSVFAKTQKDENLDERTNAKSHDHTLENETKKYVYNADLEDKSKANDDDSVMDVTITKSEDLLLDDKTSPDKIEVYEQSAKEDEIIKLDSSIEECCESTENDTISNTELNDHDNITLHDANSVRNIESKDEVMPDGKEENRVSEDNKERKSTDEGLANEGIDEDEKKLNNANVDKVDGNDKRENSNVEDSSMEVEDVVIKTPTLNKNESEHNIQLENQETLQDNSESIVPPKNVEQQYVKESKEVLDNSTIIEDENEMPNEGKKTQVSKLANMLDIISDDEGDKSVVSEILQNNSKFDQSISLVEDDDIMVIEEEDSSAKEVSNTHLVEKVTEVKDEENVENEISDKQPSSNGDTIDNICDTDVAKSLKNEKDECTQIDNTKKDVKPLLPSSLLKTCKKNLADMTREDLEEFCLLKIVESVVDRSNLGDIKAQLKTMARTVEEYKKKMMMVTKQSRDLQVILKSVQEEQKKPSVYPVTPLKITRSVGMQVLMTDKPCPKRKKQGTTANSNSTQDKSNRNTAALRPIAPKTNQQIPVPRLVPAIIPTNKANTTIQPLVSNITKPTQTTTTVTNGMRNSPPAQKPEKRTRLQSITVDLTDDEPPSKITSRNSPAPPVRLVPPQNLIAPQRQPFPTNINSPRKVYIPISSPQSQSIRPGQTILLKSVPPNQGQRQRGPTNSLGRMQSNCIRMNKVQSNRHPAPLPDAMKQYQPPNWKALPPAPELQLSRVDNGIVISWKIDGYQEENYEEISSYQLYAYQETTSPPSTALWKKIGDVKALPLPMACTLTQFLSGYKYYFAVRAVDAKSRLGPFSLPASILHFNIT